MFLKMKVVLLFSLLSSFLMLGCQNQNQSSLTNSEIEIDKNGELQNYILGGKVLPKEFLKGSHTVGLRNNHSDEICNGVILDNDLILTVAHCLVDRRLDSDIEIRFGSSMKNNYISRFAKKVITDSNYRNKGNEMEWNDVAIIFIDGQIPEGFSAIHDFVPYPYKYPQNQQLLIYGFGISDLTDNDSWGQLQFGWAQIYTNDYSKNEFTIVQRSSTHCEGDSGGPAYEFNGDGKKIFLAGIVRGGGYFMGAGRCGKSIYTSSYKIIDFLKENVNRKWVKALPH